MKLAKLIICYILIYGIAHIYGFLKNQSWNIHDWGYHTCIAVSTWWIVMASWATYWYMRSNNKKPDQQS